MPNAVIYADSLLGKALRLPLRLIPGDMQMRILKGPLRGKRWIAGSGTHGCWVGTYEHAEQRAFFAAIRDGDVVYDLGANVGLYTLSASLAVGPQGRVFSFEPSPRNLKFLRRHIALNGAENCFVYEAAVSDTSGTASFDLGTHPFMGRIADDRNNSIVVRTVTLDELVDSGEIPPPNVIKCDIEGNEFKALMGASRVLSAAAPFIFLSVHSPRLHEDCCKLLTGLGYVLSSLTESPLELSYDILANPRKR
jgi:FkbM family methyltransferase